jgi:MoaA/NifB/PqqE/SkfB family radical SAM enzyme
MEKTDMQKAHNKLTEIVFEITDNCSENCSYCGSKDILNKTVIDQQKIKNIVDKIASYSPDHIDISGGNPLLVDFDTHKYLVDTLHDRGVTCKIIVNPFNPKTPRDFDIIDLYDWTGVSINTKAELEKFIKSFSKLSCTVITNFNASNVFLFHQIYNMCVKNDICWQIQYTMYKDSNEQAIYQNQEAKKYLFDQIKDVNSPRIIVADNMVPEASCHAGMHSMGILANGDVVPCLSMRSWEDNTKIIGNLYEESLKDIWVKRFSEMRCSSFKCCKDHIESFNGPVLTATENLDTLWIKPVVPSLEENLDGGVMVYAVQMTTPKFITPYTDGGVYNYAVYKPMIHDSIKYTTTNTTAKKNGVDEY